MVEACAIACGLRVQRGLADNGFAAPVVIDRIAALSNSLAEIEGTRPLGSGEYREVLLDFSTSHFIPFVSSNHLSS